MNYRGIEYKLNDFGYVTAAEKIRGEHYFFNLSEFKQAVDRMIKRKQVVEP